MQPRPHRANKRVPWAFGRWPFLAGSSVLGLASTVQVAHAQDANDWTQHLRVGVPITLNVKAKFGFNGAYSLPAGQNGGTQTNVDHIYDDGYVRVDNTGNAAGYTGYWGYQNSSQYNSGAGTLTYHSATGYSGAGASTKDVDLLPGIELGYGTDLFHFHQGTVGWELSAGWEPIRVRDNSSFAGTATQSVFTYNTGGTVPPTAPYNGGPSGIGEPTILATPTAAGTNVISSTITGWHEIDVSLFTVRLGPTAKWKISDQFDVAAGAGPALGVVTGDYKFSEAAAGSATQNSGKISMTKLVYGGYVNAGLIYHAVENADVYLGAQFMPLSSASVSGMGREAKLDLSGALQVSAGISWPF